MITSQEQMDVYETSLSPGWDIVLREVMTRLNESAQDVLKTVRPGIDAEERMHRGGQHQGVRDVYEFLRRMEKDATTAIRAGNKTTHSAEQAQQQQEVRVL